MLIQNRVAAIASGGSASPKTMEILAEGAFVTNALWSRRGDRSTFLQIKRFRLLRLCGIRRPEDCTLPGKVEEL